MAITLHAPLGVGEGWRGVEVQLVSKNKIVYGLWAEVYRLDGIYVLHQDGDDPVGWAKRQTHYTAEAKLLNHLSAMCGCGVVFEGNTAHVVGRETNRELVLTAFGKIRSRWTGRAETVALAHTLAYQDPDFDLPADMRPSWDNRHRRARRQALGKVRHTVANRFKPLRIRAGDPDHKPDGEEVQLKRKFNEMQIGGCLVEPDSS